MHVVTRKYSGEGASALIDLLEQRKSEIEPMMRSIKGFIGYTLVRTSDGGQTFTICADKAGTDESLVKARDWIATNAGSVQAPSPEISEGSVILRLT